MNADQPIPEAARVGVSVEPWPQVARCLGLHHAGPHCRPPASRPVPRASWFCVSEGGRQPEVSGQNPQHKYRQGAPGSPAGRDSRRWRDRDGCGCSVPARPAHSPGRPRLSSGNGLGNPAQGLTQAVSQTPSARPSPQGNGARFTAL